MRDAADFIMALKKSSLVSLICTMRDAADFIVFEEVMVSSSSHIQCGRCHDWLYFIYTVTNSYFLNIAPLVFYHS